jgi:hypothetical protein
MSNIRLVITFNILILSVLLMGLYLFYSTNKNKKGIKFPDKIIVNDFAGYDYPNDKKSGVGGGLTIDNPLHLNVPSEVIDGIF